MRLHATLEFYTGDNLIRSTTATVGGRWVSTCETRAMRVAENEYPFTLRKTTTLRIVLTNGDGIRVAETLWLLVPDERALPVQPYWLTEPVGQ